MKTTLIIAAAITACTLASCQNQSKELPPNVEVMRHLRTEAAAKLRPEYEAKYGKNFDKNPEYYQRYLYDVNKQASNQRYYQIQKGYANDPSYVPVEATTQQATKTTPAAVVAPSKHTTPASGASVLPR